MLDLYRGFCPKPGHIYYCPINNFMFLVNFYIENELTGYCDVLDLDYKLPKKTLRLETHDLILIGYL